MCAYNEITNTPTQFAYIKRANETEGERTMAEYIIGQEVSYFERYRVEADSREEALRIFNEELLDEPFDLEVIEVLDDPEIVEEVDEDQ